MIKGQLVAGLLFCYSLFASGEPEYDSVRDPLGIFAQSEANMRLKMAFWENNQDLVSPAVNVPSVRNSPQTCKAGSLTAGGIKYSCDNVNFFSLVGRSEMLRTRADFDDTLFEMSDVWGWLSPQNHEITLACMTNVLWFIDSTTPTSPVLLGYIESHRTEAFWCDVKVYKDTAYIVQDYGGGALFPDRGIQVFNLTRLTENEVQQSPTPIKFAPDFTYAEQGPVHNIAVNTDTGHLFTVGSRGGTDCKGGLHIIDASKNPLKPEFLGCAAADGYVHDTQCVVYAGPDKKYTGKEICFGYNEDTLTIYDVTDPTFPIILSKTFYATAKYTHQGWLNDDQDFLLLDDELDEEFGTVINTRTYVVNVTSLDDPVFTGFYDHPTISIDHNLYFWGTIHKHGWGGNAPMANFPNLDYAYCSNYASGLRIIDASRIKDDDPKLNEAGFFDVSPTIEGNVFFGSWSNYMHPSGVIAVTSIETGVFFLNFNSAFADTIVQTDFPTAAPTKFVPTKNPTQFPISAAPTVFPTLKPTEAGEEGEESSSNNDSGVLAGLIVLYITIAIGAFIMILFNLKRAFQRESQNPTPTPSPAGDDTLIPPAKERPQSKMKSKDELKESKRTGEGTSTFNPLFEDA